MLIFPLRGNNFESRKGKRPSLRSKLASGLACAASSSVSFDSNYFLAVFLLTPEYSTPPVTQRAPSPSEGDATVTGDTPRIKSARAQRSGEGQQGFGRRACSPWLRDPTMALSFAGQGITFSQLEVHRPIARVWERSRRAGEVASLLECHQETKRCSFQSNAGAQMCTA